MTDWNDIDAQAANEGNAITGGYKGVRHMRRKAPPSRSAICNDYRVREAEEKKRNNLSLLNVIDGRKQ